MKGFSKQMEQILYKNYLKYLKDNKPPLYKTLLSIPKCAADILVALVISGAVTFVFMCAEKLRQYIIIPLAFEVVCRIGEVLGLRWEDCNFEENVININHTLIYRKFTDEPCQFSITTPKTKSGERIIPMLSDVREALKQEYMSQLEEGFNESEIDGYTGFIFKSRYNKVLAPHSVNTAIARIIKACNAKEIEDAM